MHKLLAFLVGLLMVAVNAFAAVNVNTANESELQALTGIGPAKAKAIIDYRAKNGPFKTVDDLLKVPGIGPGILGKMKGDVTLTGPTTTKNAATPTIDAGKTANANPAAAKAATPTATASSAPPVTTPAPAPATPPTAAPASKPDAAKPAVSAAPPATGPASASSKASTTPPSATTAPTAAASTTTKPAPAPAAKADDKKSAEKSKKDAEQGAKK